MQAMRGVDVTVAARLGETSLSVREILDLRPGATVAFPQKVALPVYLEVNGNAMARGHIVERAGRLGFLLTETCSRERSTRAGGERPSPS